MMKNASLPKISILLQFGGERANIWLPNCNKMLIFGKQAFFIMFFPNILTNPIISKIQIFVTSHFRTLLDSTGHLPEDKD